MLAGKYIKRIKQKNFPVSYARKFGRQSLSYLFCCALIIVSFTSYPLEAANNETLSTEIKRLILTEQYQQLEPKLRNLAIQGNAEGRYQLGVLYLHGKGVTASRQMALYWFEKAAKQDHEKAQFNSAMLLMRESRNIKKALIYLESAATNGHNMADKYLQNMAAESKKIALMDQNSLDHRLIYSIKKAQENEVDTWLKAGADPNSVDNGGRTTLIVAVESKHLANLTLLLKAGADPRLADSTGNTPIHFATMTHNRNLLRPLAKQGDLEQRNQQGQTALLLAIELGDSILVKELLSLGSNASALKSDGSSALDSAQAKSNNEIVNLLRKHGAKSTKTGMNERRIRLANIREQLKQPQFEGWDELMFAASTGDSELVGWLLLQDSPSTKYYEVGKAISQSIIASSNETINVFLNHPSANSVGKANAREILELALKYGDLVLFSRLYEHSIMREASWESIGNLLRNAITEEKPDIAIYLVQSGTPRDFVANDGETHLMAASKRGQQTVVTELLKSGAAINQKDSLGRTALWHSCFVETEPLVRLLLSNGASVDLADQDGRTALMIAVQKNNPGIVKQLLRSDASLDNASKNGNTPLHLITKDTSSQLVSLMIERNADISRRNNNSLTPLMIAAQVSNKTVVTLLLQAGADPDRKSQKGQTAIDMATNKQIATLLNNY